MKAIHAEMLKLFHKWCQNRHFCEL